MNLFSIFKRKPSERLALLVEEQRRIFLMLSIKQRAALIDIHNQGINSKSGTARAMARKAGEALL